MIRHIYSNRTFIIRNGGTSSVVHTQHFGISQGCPLSPVLFTILMTIVINDAKASLREAGWQLSNDLIIHDLLYADDTLLIEVNDGCLSAYMEQVERHWSSVWLSFKLEKD